MTTKLFRWIARFTCKRALRSLAAILEKFPPLFRKPIWTARRRCRLQSPSSGYETDIQCQTKPSLSTVGYKVLEPAKVAEFNMQYTVLTKSSLFDAILSLKLAGNNDTHLWHLSYTLTLKLEHLSWHNSTLILNNPIWPCPDSKTLDIHLDTSVWRALARAPTLSSARGLCRHQTAGKSIVSQADDFREPTCLTSGHSRTKQTVVNTSLINQWD